MSQTKETKLTIRGDRPTAISSSAHRSNIDAIGFNILFIASRNPKIAIKILKLCDAARQVQEDEPLVPDENSELFADELVKMYGIDLDG